MHIVALNQFYAPHGSATAQLLTELAEGLVRRGHRVTVVTSGPRFSSTFRGRARAHHQTSNGVDVIRIPSTHLGKGNLVKRAADYLTFYAEALRALVQLPTAPDVFLPLTTPPFVAIAAQLAALRSYVPGQPLRGLRSHVPVVPLVQDLYPDVAVRLGVLRHGGLAHKGFAALAGVSLRNATHVIALSDLMAEHLRGYGVKPGAIDVIPNWALSEVEAAPASGTQARLEYGFGARGRFVVMYSGNLGAGHQFETLLAAARRLRDDPDIVFAFVGEGVRKAEVERFIRLESLSNVRVFPLAPLSKLADSLGAADLHVITMRDGLEGLVVPSKLYGILAAARPALFIGPARDSVADTLRAAEAGLCFDNGDVEGVVAAITHLAKAPDRARAMGEAGRRHLLAHLGRERAIDAYERVLTLATANATVASPPAQTTPADARRPRR